MDLRHGQPVAQGLFDGLMDRPEGRSPSHHRQAAGNPLLDGLLRQVIGHLGDLGGAQVGHGLVVGGIIGDVAGFDVLLDAADPMDVARIARCRPEPGQAVGFPLPNAVGRRCRGLAVGDGLECVNVGNGPKLRGVGDVAVGEQDHGRHVAQGDAHCLYGGCKAVRWGSGGQHRHGGVGVAAVHGLVEVALLGLGRHAGGRAGPLRIDHHQGQLGRNRQPQGLGFQGDAGPGAGSHSQFAGIGGADGGADGGDLILRLKCGDASLLQSGEMMQQSRGGRDGIGAEQQLGVAQFPRCGQPQGQGLRPGDGAVGNRFQRRFGNGMLGENVLQFGSLAVGVASGKRSQIGVANRFMVGELGLNPAGGGIPRLVEHPQHQAQRPKVLAARGVLGAQAKGLHRLQGQVGDVHAANVEVIEAAILEGIGGELRAPEPLCGKGAVIDDDERSRRQVGQVDCQGRRIEGQQHVGRVARRRDAFAAELDLKSRNAVAGAGRRAYFGREVGQGGQVVPSQRRGDRELLALQLNAVPGIAGKAHDMAVFFGKLLRHAVGGQGSPRVERCGILTDSGSK